jgi:hypothetical protein
VSESQKPVVVVLSDALRGADAEAVAAVSPRVRVAFVNSSGEPLDDVSDAEVAFRGGGLMPPGLKRLLPRMPHLRWTATSRPRSSPATSLSAARAGCTASPSASGC